MPLDSIASCPLVADKNHYVNFASKYLISLNTPLSKRPIFVYIYIWFAVRTPYSKRNFIVSCLSPSTPHRNASHHIAKIETPPHPHCPPCPPLPPASVDWNASAHQSAPLMRWVRSLYKSITYRLSNFSPSSKIRSQLVPWSSYSQIITPSSICKSASNQLFANQLLIANLRITPHHFLFFKINSLTTSKLGWSHHHRHLA